MRTQCFNKLGQSWGLLNQPIEVVSLWEVFQIARYRNNWGVPISTPCLPNHTRDICSIYLGQFELCHDNVKLHLAESVAHSLCAIHSGDRTAPELLKQAFHHHPGDRMVLADQYIQWPEEWALGVVKLGKAPGTLTLSLVFEQLLRTWVFIVG